MRAVMGYDMVGESIRLVFVGWERQLWVVGVVVVDHRKMPGSAQGGGFGLRRG
jgi:hypothetical protein